MELENGSDEYNHNLINYFEPVIKLMLVPSHITSSLATFLGDASALNKIKRKERFSKEDAVELLLEVLRNSGHRGWFTAFIDALNVNEYDLLAGIITGDRKKHSDVFNNLILVFGKPLIQDIDPLEIVDHLVETKALSVQDQREILAEVDHETKMSGMIMLLDRISKHTNYWFPELIAALKDGPRQYQELAKDMEPAIYKACPGMTYEVADEVQKINERPEQLRTDSIGTSSIIQSQHGRKRMVDSQRYQHGEQKKVCAVVPTCSITQDFESMEVNEGDTIEEPVLRFGDMGQQSLPLNAGNEEFSLDERSLPDGHEVSPRNDDCQTSSLTDNVSATLQMNLNFDQSATEIQRSDREMDTEQTALKTYIADQNRPESCETNMMMSSCTGDATYSEVDTNNLGASFQQPKQIADKDKEILNISENTDDGIVQENNENQHGEQKKVCAVVPTCSITQDFESMEVNEGDTIEEPVLRFGDMGQQSLPLNAGNEEFSLDERSLPDGHEVSPRNDDAVETNNSEDHDETSDEIQAETLCLRSYQEELAEPAIMGQNTIIVAPTGSGKTHVALHITKQHMEELEKEDEKGKVVFFVPTVELVSQQHAMYRKYLSHYRTYNMSGDVQDSQRVPLIDLIDNNDVMIMTPQILVDNLDKGLITSLGIFTLMIFDECHHATKAHPYNSIMAMYLKEKFSEIRTFILPQVVGLTASVGVGKARDRKAAQTHILSLCANLDAQGISTVDKNSAQLEKFINKPNEEKVETTGRTDDPFKRIINKVMATIEQCMREFIEKQNSRELAAVDQFLQTPAARRGCDPYIQWHSKLQKAAAVVQDQNIRRKLYSCLAHLKVYNIALVINEDCRTRDAVDYVLRQFKEIDEKHKDETDKWLDQLYDKERNKLEDVCHDSRYKNPKLEALKGLIKKKYRENEDMRVIIFCKTRDMTLAMKNWMDNTEDIRDLNPHRIVGSTTSAEKGGMTQSAHVDVLKYFKAGKHKVLIATSVAEEGLDVSKCNLVIRYEYVTNEIAMVQSRGRGRADDSEYVVLGDTSRGASQKESLNKIRENMMNESIKAVRRMDPEERQRSISQLQREAQHERKMTEAGKRSKEANKSRVRRGDWELRCLKCNAYACMSEDIRQVEASHHVVIDSDFDDRIIIEPHPDQKHIGDLKKTDKIFCKNCRSDWGIRAIYKYSKFSVIKIVSFIIINITTNKRDTRKKWKDVPFAVSPLTPDELSRYAEDIVENQSDTDQ